MHCHEHCVSRVTATRLRLQVTINSVPSTLRWGLGLLGHNNRLWALGGFAANGPCSGATCLRTSALESAGDAPVAATLAPALATPAPTPAPDLCPAPIPVRGSYQSPPKLCHTVLLFSCAGCDIIPPWSRYVQECMCKAVCVRACVHVLAFLRLARALVRALVRACVRARARACAFARACMHCGSVCLRAFLCAWISTYVGVCVLGFASTRARFCMHFCLRACVVLGLERGAVRLRACVSGSLIYQRQ